MGTTTAIFIAEMKFKKKSARRFINNSVQNKMTVRTALCSVSDYMKDQYFSLLFNNNRAFFLVVSIAFSFCIHLFGVLYFGHSTCNRSKIGFESFESLQILHAHWVWCKGSNGQNVSVLPCPLIPLVLWKTTKTKIWGQCDRLEWKNWTKQNWKNGSFLEKIDLRLRIFSPNDTFQPQAYTYMVG